MSIISILLPVLASTAGVRQTPERAALDKVSNLLRIGDEGLRYRDSSRSNLLYCHSHTYDQDQ
jgi:hypothetical protein